MYVDTQYFTFAEYPEGFSLESGRSLSPVTLAYETYGELNARGDNAVLILHGFTADAHAAGVHQDTGLIGWWDDMIGPGKAFDTDRYYVVSSNVLGGCGGSTGPSSVNPITGRPYGITFPIFTIKDIVDAQYELLLHLNVTSLAALSGASMGGQQALQWIISYPNFVRTAIPIACSARLSAMGLAISEVSRQSIIGDPNWMNGAYYGVTFPSMGLALARMAAHLTYVSGDYLDLDYGRRLLEKEQDRFKLGGYFQVQQYLRDEGESFVKRFDANSFLYLSQAIEHFDLTKDVGSLPMAFENVCCKVVLISFRTDWLFPVAHLREIEHALRDNNVDVTHVTVETTYGHDAFVTDWRKISPLIADYVNGPL
jgi:homoserine O-acetyltransferase